MLDAVEAAGGGGGVMESLLLSHCHLGPAGLAPAPLTPAQQLTVSRTRRLEVLRCYSADLHAPLRLVLQQLPALQDLELRKVNVWYADLAGLLGAATALAGLTLLDCGLAGLPPGDYLAGAWPAGGGWPAWGAQTAASLPTLSCAVRQQTACPLP